MKVYDFAKVTSYIQEHANDITEVYLGMHEDWFWTAISIYEDGKFTEELNDDTLIAGIKGSTWATPTMKVCRNDGTDTFIEVSKGESTRLANNMSLGCLSGPVQESIAPISAKI